MQQLLETLDDKLDSDNPLEMLVAGILVTNDFDNVDRVVKKMVRLRQMSNDLQLDKEQEFILHSWHTLRKFVLEDEEDAISEFTDSIVPEIQEVEEETPK